MMNWFIIYHMEFQLQDYYNLFFCINLQKSFRNTNYGIAVGTHNSNENIGYDTRKNNDDSSNFTVDFYKDFILDKSDRNPHH